MAASENLQQVQFRKYYHGTQTRNVESILKHGLKMHDPAEDMVAMYGESYREPGHPKGVYFSTSKEGAAGYGDDLIEAELPDIPSMWGWTESDGHVWVGGDIGPHFVKHVPHPWFDKDNS